MLRPDQPLYLPKGSVRALLAISVTVAALFGLVSEQVLLLVLGGYFAQRLVAKGIENGEASSE